MTSAFIEQSITTVPGGYDFCSPLHIPQLKGRLAVEDAEILATYLVFHNGECRQRTELELTFRGGKLVGKPPAPFTLPDHVPVWGSDPGFVEFSFTSKDGSEVFLSKQPLSFYSIYSKPGKKSFLVDNIHKFGSPPVINQIAEFGRFTDGYVVVHIDRDRDTAESLILINPYLRPVVARILMSDGWKIPRIKIPPLSARYVRLEQNLDAQERAWLGQLQITASNRLLTYSVKHSIADPGTITAHEHMDPFRADPTHMPATQLFRNWLGRKLNHVGKRGDEFARPPRASRT